MEMWKMVVVLGLKNKKRENKIEKIGEQRGEKLENGRIFRGKNRYFTPWALRAQRHIKI